MPYAPDAFAALVLQPLSRCHMGPRAAISPVEKPNEGNRLQATSRFPEYAEHPAAGGATGAGAVVLGAALVVVVVAGAGGVVAAGVVGAGFVVGAAVGDSVAVGRTSL